MVDEVVVDTPATEVPVEGTEVAPVVKKFKVKVDGQESEVEESELIAGYQTRKASAKHMEEAAAMRKQSEQFIAMLKKDPIKILSHPALGHDLRKLAEEYLGGVLEDELLDPTARELKQLKRQMQEAEEKTKAEKEDADGRIQEELRGRYTEHYNTAILKVLETSGLPKTSDTVKRMAYYLHQGLVHRMDLKPEDVVDLVREDYLITIKDLLGSAEAEKLVELLGADVVKKVRKVEVEKIKNNPMDKVRTPEKQGSPRGGQKKESQDLTKFMRSLRNK